MLGPSDLVLCGPPIAHIPLLDRLAPAQKAGFAAVSVTPGDLWALDEQGVSLRDLSVRLSDHGLQLAEVDCIGCWLPSHAHAPADARFRELLLTLTPERVIDLAARAGARSVVAVEMMGVTPSLDEAAEAFARICDLAAEHGLPVHIEFLPFGGIADLAAAWAIVEAAGRPNGGLTLDSWHLFRSGSTLQQLAAIPGERIFTVQINDAPARPGADLFEETMTGRLLPGEGDFDLTGFIRTLDRIGSNAPIGVEVFSQAQAGATMDQISMAWASSARATIEKARNSDER